MRAKKKKRSKTPLIKKLLVLVVVLSIAGVGAYNLVTSHADAGAPWCDDGNCAQYVPNPPLARNCGIDVLLLVDGSGSMGTLPENGDGTDSFYVATRAMKNLINTLNNTQMYFAVGKIDQSDYRQNNHETVFTQNIATLNNTINNFESGGGSDIADLSWVNEIDPRRDRQNLIIVLTDFEIGLSGAQSISNLKRNGTRILSLEVREEGEASTAKHRTVTNFTSGPLVNTGNLLTSDVVTMTPSQIGTNFSALSQQLCSPPGGGGGQGGSGTGTGNGGRGTGTNGQGSGGGGGGGGSSATTQADANNVTPSSSGQGDSAKQLKIEPSPFFDGKLFTIGSDKDLSIEKDKSMAVVGLRVGYGWLYAFGAIVILGVGGWFGWKKLGPKTKAKLKLKK